MVRRMVILLALTLSLLALAAAPAAAQTYTTGSVGVVVVNQNGAPIAGAQVTLNATNYSQGSYTEADGKVNFDQLPANMNFSVQVDLAGQPSQTKQGQVLAGQYLLLQFQMK